MPIPASRQSNSRHLDCFHELDTLLRRYVIAGSALIEMEDDGVTPYIRFRLGNIDSYQGTPTSYDRNDYPKVPIIRIWGAADETGQKVW